MAKYFCGVGTGWICAWYMYMIICTWCMYTVHILVVTPVHAGLSLASLHALYYHLASSNVLRNNVLICSKGAIHVQ